MGLFIPIFFKKMTIVKFLYKPCTPRKTQYWIKYDQGGASLGIQETCNSVSELHTLLKQLFKPEQTVVEIVDDLVVWECDRNGDPKIWLFEYHYDFDQSVMELEVYAMSEEFVLSIRTDNGEYPQTSSDIPNTPMIIE